MGASACASSIASAGTCEYHLSEWDGEPCSMLVVGRGGASSRAGCLGGRERAFLLFPRLLLLPSPASSWVVVPRFVVSPACQVPDARRSQLALLRLLRARARRGVIGGMATSAGVAGPLIPDDCFLPDGVRLPLPPVEGGTLNKKKVVGSSHRGEVG